MHSNDILLLAKYRYPVSNTLGLVPGSISKAFGFCKELDGQRDRAYQAWHRCPPWRVVGAFLLVTYPGAFQQIVPYLIIAAVTIMAFQPRISKALTKRSESNFTSGLLYGGIFLTAIYGGFFGTLPLQPGRPYQFQRNGCKVIEQ